VRTMFEFRSRDEDFFSHNLAKACTEAPRHQIARSLKLRWMVGGARRHRPASAAACCRAFLGESGAYRSKKERAASRADDEATRCEPPACDLSCSDPPLAARTFARVVAAADRFLTGKCLCNHHGWRSSDVARNIAARRHKVLISRRKILCLRVIYMLRRARARDKIFSSNKSAPARSGDKMAPK
jgi:hypothetical protein